MSFRNFRRRAASPVPVSRTSISDPKRSLEARWGSLQLFAEGFVAVPTALLRHYTALNLNNSELVFVMELMCFKWDEAAPFPSYTTLAQRMGVTTEAVRNHAKALEDKGLLRRVKRSGRTNAFELRPLTEKLVALLDSEAPRQVA